MTPNPAPADVSTTDFEGLEIAYDARVLAPRPWTAAQSHWAADLIAEAPPGPVLEVCAGVGHIGLLAVTLAPRPLVCVDASAAACELLRHNAASNAATADLDVEVREGRMDEVLEPDERFAVVIADPPWVRSEEITQFPEDPVTAIDGGSDGFDLARACLDVIAAHLLPGGSAVLQVGPDQAGLVRAAVASYDGLVVVEDRSFERGALVRIDRPA